MDDKMVEQATYFQHFLNMILGRPLTANKFSTTRWESAEDAQAAWQHARAECVDFERALDEFNFPFSEEVLGSVSSFREWEVSLAYRKADELHALGITLEFDDRDAATARQIAAGKSVPGMEFYAYAKRKELRQKYRDAALRAIASTPWLRAYLEDLRSIDDVPDASDRAKETMRLWLKHSGLEPENGDI